MSRVRLLLAAAIAAMATFVVGGGIDARAQLIGTTTTTTAVQPTTTVPDTTTIPLRPGESTTTTQPPPPPEPVPPDGGAPPGGAPGGEPAPTPGAPADPARPPADPTAAPGAPVSGDPAASAVPPGDQPLAAADPRAVPEDVQRLISSIRRSPANSTRRLFEALRPLQNLGLSMSELIDVGFGSFPVGGPTTFVDDWYFPRFVPSFHLHEGTDLFAACGTPARSPADGVLKLSQGGSGGLAAYVYRDDGGYYYLAHLQRFVPTLRSGQRVRRGELVGYVGDTGNAVGGPCHIHFEIHPAPSRQVVSGRGKDRKVTLEPRPVPIGSRLEPVNPKPYLDAWLNEAVARVPQLIAAVEGRPRALVATATTRGLAAGGPLGVAAPAMPSRSALLWATSASPAGGAWRLAEAEALSVASELDWAGLARRQQQRLEDEHRARVLTDALLTPLTPPALRAQSDQGVD